MSETVRRNRQRCPAASSKTTAGPDFEEMDMFRRDGQGKRLPGRYPPSAVDPLMNYWPSSANDQSGTDFSASGA